LNYKDLTAYGDWNINDNNVVLGIALADRLRVTTFDTLKIISPKMLQYSLQTLNIPTGINVKPSGFFQSNVKEYDLTNCYANSLISKKLLGINENVCSYIDITIINNNELDAVYA
jgi:ABC-type lipoprotein release transport system permease subunit